MKLKPKDKFLKKNKKSIDAKLAGYDLNHSCFRRRDPSNDDTLSIMSELVLLNEKHQIELFP